jgi:hypothetical protein
MFVSVVAVTGSDSLRARRNNHGVFIDRYIPTGLFIEILISLSESHKLDMAIMGTS